jgi:hypothetical protein
MFLVTNDGPTPKSGATEQDEHDTIADLWSALLRYVPKGEKRAEAAAIATVLNYFLKNEAGESRQAAVSAAYDQGVKNGKDHARAEAQLRAYQQHGIVLYADDTQDEPRIHGNVKITH